MTERLLASLDEVTERLRALLNERGVEWWETVTFIGATITDEGIERHYLVSTWWVSPLFGKVEATDMGDGVLHMACLNGCYFTPAQAIAATLGAGTCQQEEGGWSTEGDHARVWLTCGHDCMVETVADLPNFCPECGAKVVDE